MSDPIGDAVAAIRRGDLVVLPTDTVYGIASRPDDAAATARIFDAKQRPRGLELPVLVPDADAARRIAAFDVRAERLASRWWPGALTLVLPRTDTSSSWDLGGDPTTVGVRVPRHPLALALLSRTGPLAVTSANRSGSPTPSTCDAIVAAFGDSVDVYLCEEVALEGLASTVVDLAHGEASVLREGAIPSADVLSALRSG